MFNDSEFFYYSEDFDLTTSLQRQHSADYQQDAALWRRADTRFFWNRHMLAELIELDVSFFFGVTNVVCVAKEEGRDR